MIRTGTRLFGYALILGLATFHLLAGGRVHADSEDTSASIQRPPITTVSPNLEIMPIAHRGVKKIAPENTLPAIEAAIALGYEYVEIDVRYSKDGVPILMHDDWIDRTTNGRGPPGRHDLAALQSLDAGFWKGREYRGTRIPTVEEALALMEGKIKLYLDQKDLARPALIALMKAHGFYPENVVVVGSGAYVDSFLAHEPEAPVMPRLHPGQPASEVLTRYPTAIAFNSSCDTLTAAMVEDAHAHGVMVFTNVLNVPKALERECMRNPIELGADAIQLDNMPLFFEVLAEMKREAATAPASPEFLCPDASDPEAAADKVRIECALERGEFSPPGAKAAPQREILIAAYNLERGMYLDQQASILSRHPEFAGADVILISEADRGCSRVGYRNVTRELARELRMNYAFGVQYVELPRRSDEAVNDNQTICEHGNAVLSRHPIINVEQIRHRDVVNWYLPPGPERDEGQPRLGGSITLAADIDVAGRIVRVYSTHLASDIDRESIVARTSQARELVEHARGFDGPVVMGGDFNVINYTMDLMIGTRTDEAVASLFDAGFDDAHSSLPVGRRGTTGRDYVVRGIIDLIFVRDAVAVDAGACSPRLCGPLSDHLPVWARVRIDR